MMNGRQGVLCTNWVHADYIYEGYRGYFTLVDESGDLILKIPCGRRVTFRIGESELVYRGGKFVIHRQKEKDGGGWIDIAIPIHIGSEFAITYREFAGHKETTEFLDIKMIRRE